MRATTVRSPSLRATDPVVTALQSVPEMFYFRPREFTVDVGYEFGVDDMINRAVHQAPIDVTATLTRSIVLAGGNTMFRGCPDVLVRRLKSANAPIFGRVSNVKVKPPRCGGREYSCAESAWLGGCKLAMAPGFAQPDASGNQMYATDDDYDEKGPELICNEMNILRNDDEL